MMRRRGFDLVTSEEVRQATDYDTPRKTDEELHEESLEELKANVDAQSGPMLMRQKRQRLELPGDLSSEELAVRVVQNRMMNLPVHVVSCSSYDSAWRRRQSNL